jgi:hypothetical protein
MPRDDIELTRLYTSMLQHVQPPPRTTLIKPDGQQIRIDMLTHAPYMMVDRVFFSSLTDVCRAHDIDPAQWKHAFFVDGKAVRDIMQSVRSRIKQVIAGCFMLHGARQSTNHTCLVTCR